MTKLIHALAAGAFAAVVVFLSATSLARADFVVLVNAGNKFSGAENDIKAQVKRLYLKEIKEWPGGVRGLVFSRADDSAAQKAFTKAILGMDAARIEAHWKKMKQTTGDTPPRAVASARLLLRQIAKDEGALGILDETEIKDIPPEVRVLLKFSE